MQGSWRWPEAGCNNLERLERIRMASGSGAVLRVRRKKQECEHSRDLKSVLIHFYKSRIAEAWRRLGKDFVMGRRLEGLQPQRAD